LGAKIVTDPALSEFSNEEKLRFFLFSNQQQEQKQNEQHKIRKVNLTATAT
jgi:hypothetical protein